MHTEIRQVEERLRTAMLTSDLTELDALIDDQILFIGPDSGVYRKADDIELYRSGAQRVTHIDVEDMLIELHESIAVAVVLANLAVVLHGQAFEGRCRYIRTWMRGEQGWRIVAGSVCAVPA